mgnify:CR=1 FL=1
MTTVDVDPLHVRLTSRLAENVPSRVVMQVVGDSGLSIKIDGQRSLTSIGVWSNGCCDVDYLFAESESGKLDHYEFGNIEEAIEPVLCKIGFALERA